MIKKIIFGSISVIGLSTAVIFGSSLVNTSADDSVTIQMFNELKAKVETLETQLNDANNEITTLKTINEEVNSKIAVIEDKTNQNATTIKGVKTDLNTVTNRTTKIEAREKVLYERGRYSRDSLITISNYILQNMYE